MALPIYKVISLVIRVFSKPLVTYVKQAHLKKQSSNAYPFVRKFFVGLGNAYNKGQSFVNRKFMKIQSKMAYKPLNEQLAIQKGVQFLYQIIFYSIVIGLPLYEMIRAANQAKVKSQALEQKLQKITSQLQQISTKQSKRQTGIETVATQKVQQVPSNNKKQILIPVPTYNINKSQGLLKHPNESKDHKAHKYRIYFVDEVDYQDINMQRVP